MSLTIAGRFRGKRVILLKDLGQGVLRKQAPIFCWIGSGAEMLTGYAIVVTGPFKINGVPLRRVNARYVIATSTSIDVKGLDVSIFPTSITSHQHYLTCHTTVQDPRQSLRAILLGHRQGREEEGRGSLLQAGREAREEATRCWTCRRSEECG